jgi:NADH-quinone oxidoreductase subunit D
MDGERILEAEPTIGYIHSFRKNCGKPSFYQITPLTGMNYCSSPINNMGWWMTLENLDIEVPKRAIFKSYCDGMLVTDHIICNSILGVDTGVYWILYVFNLEKKCMRFMKKFVELV